MGEEPIPDRPERDDTYGAERDAARQLVRMGLHHDHHRRAGFAFVEFTDRFVDDSIADEPPDAPLDHPSQVRPQPGLDLFWFAFDHLEMRRDSLEDMRLRLDGLLDALRADHGDDERPLYQALTRQVLVLDALAATHEALARRHDEAGDSAAAAAARQQARQLRKDRHSIEGEAGTFDARHPLPGPGE